MDTSVNEYIQKIKSEKSIITIAKYLRFLHIDKQMRTKDLADILGLNQSYICNLYRLNKLPEYIIDGYYAKTITKSTLFTLSRLHTPEEMLRGYEEVLTKNLTPNQTEEVVREIKHGIITEGEKITKQEKEEAVKKLITKYQNTSVKIVQTRIHGKIMITIKGGLKKTTKIMHMILQSLENEEETHKDS